MSPNVPFDCGARVRARETIWLFRIIFCELYWTVGKDNVAGAFTARESHTAVRPTARPGAGVSVFRGVANGRPHSGEPGTGQSARRAPDDRGQCIRGVGSRRVDRRTRRAGNVYLRARGEAIFSAAAVKWAQRCDAGNSAGRDCIYGGAAFR